MKNHCGEAVGFSFKAALWFRRLANFLLFLPSSVMILLAFLSCFLVFFFVKDQIASFQLKKFIVFLN